MSLAFVELPQLTEQLVWNAAAIVGAGVACVFTLIRRHMLRGDVPIWFTAGGLVQGALALQAILFGVAAISIVFGRAAGQVETVLEAASALVSMVMAINLDRNGRLPPPRREPPPRANGAGPQLAAHSLDPRSFADRGGPPPTPN